MISAKPADIDFKYTSKDEGMIGSGSGDKRWQINFFYKYVLLFQPDPD